MIRILIADDHQLIRDAWAMILSRDRRFNIIGSCSNSDEAVKMSRKHKPDILLLDINMTPYSGIEAAKKIRMMSPATGIIAVTISNHPVHLKQMFLLGALGYVTKNSSVPEMKDAILAVYEGKKYICNEMKELLLDVHLRDNEDSAVHSLTGRELEIVKLINEGLSSKEISTTLDIALKTVETHRHNILKKIKVKNAVSLIHAMNDNAVRI
jgi:DNA-binding NarL/FixJ family response regulator